jgi:transposase
MPRRSRYSIPIESLSDTCTVCGKLIPPSLIARLDSERSRCPHCGGIYGYGDKGSGQSGSVGFTGDDDAMFHDHHQVKKLGDA